MGQAAPGDLLRTTVRKEAHAMLNSSLLYRSSYAAELLNMGGCASKSGSGRRKAAYGKPSVQGAASEDSETPEYIQLPRFANSVLAVTE